MSSKIHPTAIIDPSAKLGEGVAVGPYAIVGAESVLGDGCEIASHAVIGPYTLLGRGNRIFPHACVGGEPQDLKFKGEKSFLELGDENLVREFVTLNRGVGEGGRTVIGSRCLFMAYSHVGHDCILGSDLVVANSVALAGHVTVEDHAVLGGLCAVHQYARIGAYAMAGGGCMMAKDVVPYVMISGDIPQMFGLNVIGLKRHGFTPGEIKVLDEAYKLLFRSKMNTSQALEALAALADEGGRVRHLIDFVKSSQRGIHK
jgi:UDP-N-acetylglucosamine acyltransferase